MRKPGSLKWADPPINERSQIPPIIERSQIGGSSHAEMGSTTDALCYQKVYLILRSCCICRISSVGTRDRVCRTPQNAPDRFSFSRKDARV